MPASSVVELVERVDLRLLLLKRTRHRLLAQVPDQVWWNPSMPLCSLRGVLGQAGLDLSSDESLQAADDLSFAEAFRGAALDIDAGGFVSTHPDDRDDEERAVRGAVTASAESVASTFGTSPANVSTRVRVVGNVDDRDDVEGPIELPVSAAIRSV